MAFDVFLASGNLPADAGVSAVADDLAVASIPVVGENYDVLIYLDTIQNEIYNLWPREDHTFTVHLLHLVNGFCQIVPSHSYKEF